MTHASVFSGIGGPEVAAEMLGWENLFHCEINPFGRAVLQYWFPNAKSYEDITKTDFSEWGGKVNVLTGGFPCQPFSYAGQRRGADDDRYLWPYMHRCINQVRPDWVVCENVAGILTMVEQGSVTEMAAEKSLFDEADTLHRYRLDETFTLERICNDLESDGYAVQAVVIPACAVNAPHRRDRVFIIGHRNDITNTDCDGLCARRSSGRIWEKMDGRRIDEPLNGIERFSAPRSSADPSDTGLQETRPEQQAAGDRGFGLRDGCDAADPSLMHFNGCQSGDRCDGSGKPQPEFGSRDCTATERGATAHPDCNRGGEMDEHLQPRLADGAEPVGNGRERDVTHTGSERPQTGHRGRETGEKSRDASGWYARSDCDIAGLGRWDEFPTQSPVHRGNDGLSVPPYYDAIYQERNNMDRDNVIQGAISTGKIEVDFETGCIYSTRIRGHEGERIQLNGSNCNGYIVHTISFNGIKKQCRAHQIVWIAAHGLYDKQKFQIDHINRNRKDNRLCNLRLVTAAENIANSERKDTRILGDKERMEIWQLYNEGHGSIREIADDYGVSKSLVYNIVHEFPDLTISPSKWRTESLKAYGNAIVPQVMYEIFKAIESTYQ